MSKISVCVAVALGLGLVAGGTVRAETGVTDAEVKLGMVNVQSGAAAGLGKGMRSGAEAVFKDRKSVV